MRMLKRHLINKHTLTPDAYRERYGLASDYPMVAPNYSARRSEIAKEIGLGNTSNQAG
jgi:predicted transcriptional regulator